MHDVQASRIPDLMDPGSVKTFGAESKDLDWQVEWQQRLAANKNSKGKWLVLTLLICRGTKPGQANAENLTTCKYFHFRL